MTKKATKPNDGRGSGKKVGQFAGTQVKVKGKMYGSFREAEQATGISRNLLQKYTVDGVYLGRKEFVVRGAEKQITGQSKPGTPVTIDGVEYPSVYAAARATEYSETTIRNNTVDGVFQNDRPLNKGEIGVEIHGVKYRSMRQAERETGIRRTEISANLENGVYTGDAIPRERPGKQAALRK